MSLTHVSPSTFPDYRSDELELFVTLHVMPEFYDRLRAVIDSDPEFTLDSVVADALLSYLDSLECPDEDADAIAALKPKVSLPFGGKVAADAPRKVKGYPSQEQIQLFVSLSEAEQSAYLENMRGA